MSHRAVVAIVIILALAAVIGRQATYAPETPYPTWESQRQLGAE